MSDLISDLKRDEGCRLTAYPDPLTHADPWTIGYGHTGPEVHKGLVWTQAQADYALETDVHRHTSELIAAAPWIDGLDRVRKDVLLNMAFNMGVAGLMGFKNTLAFVKAGDWPKAAHGLLASKWATQVGARATRLSLMMLNGTRA